MKRTKATLAAWVIVAMFLTMTSLFLWASTVPVDRESSASYAESVYTLIGVTREVEKLISSDWQTINNQQEDFFRQFYEPCKNEQVSDVESIASENAEVINNFLVKKEFPELKLDPFGPDGFGSASVLKILIEWLRTGTKTQVSYNGVTYPAVKLWGDTIAFFRPQFKRIESYTIAQARTKSEYKVYMMIFHGPYPREYGNLTLLAREFWHKMEPISEEEEYEELVFPMINMKTMYSLKWLNGLRNGKAHVTNNFHSLEFKMNEKGALAKAASVMEGVKGIYTPKVFTIDRPFLLWITQPGLAYPKFVTVLGVDSWKDPGRQL